MTVADAEACAIRHGQAVSDPDGEGAQDEREQRRAYNRDGVFLAILEYRLDRRQWQPTRVFHSDGPSPYAPQRHQLK